MLFETQATKCHFMLALPMQKSKATLLDTPGISSVFRSCAIHYTSLSMLYIGLLHLRFPIILSAQMATCGQRAVES